MNISKYKVSFREKLYFSIMLVSSAAIYYWAYNLITNIFNEINKSASLDIDTSSFKTIMFMYLILYFIISLISGIILNGYIKGNAVKISSNQFPDIYQILVNQCAKLGLSKIPNMYVMQSGGALNAFATKFFGKSYVILYSDILQIAYTKGTPAVEFVIGHELGHIKRNHISWFWKVILAPSYCIPFLTTAYSRSCEYTCDSIGRFLSSEGAKDGLIILAAGELLSSKVNIDEYVINANKESGFATWFAEIFSTHPHLAKRLKACL